MHGHLEALNALHLKPMNEIEAYRLQAWMMWHGLRQNRKLEGGRHHWMLIAVKCEAIKQRVTGGAA